MNLKNANGPPLQLTKPSPPLSRSKPPVSVSDGTETPTTKPTKPTRPQQQPTQPAQQTQQTQPIQQTQPTQQTQNTQPTQQTQHAQPIQQTRPLQTQSTQQTQPTQTTQQSQPTQQSQQTQPTPPIQRAQKPPRRKPPENANGSEETSASVGIVTPQEQPSSGVTIPLKEVSSPKLTLANRSPVEAPQDPTPHSPVVPHRRIPPSRPTPPSLNVPKSGVDEATPSTPDTPSPVIPKRPLISSSSSPSLPSHSQTLKTSTHPMVVTQSSPLSSASETVPIKKHQPPPTNTEELKVNTSPSQSKPRPPELKSLSPSQSKPLPLKAKPSSSPQQSSPSPTDPPSTNIARSASTPSLISSPSQDVIEDNNSPKVVRWKIPPPARKPPSALVPETNNHNDIKPTNTDTPITDSLPSNNSLPTNSTPIDNPPQSVTPPPRSLNKWQQKSDSPSKQQDNTLPANDPILSTDNSLPNTDPLPSRRPNHHGGAVPAKPLITSLSSGALPSRPFKPKASAIKKQSSTETTLSPPLLSPSKSTEEEVSTLLKEDVGSIPPIPPVRTALITVIKPPAEITLTKSPVEVSTKQAETVATQTPKWELPSESEAPVHQISRRLIGRRPVGVVLSPGVVDTNTEPDGSGTPALTAPVDTNPTVTDRNKARLFAGKSLPNFLAGLSPFAALQRTDAEPATFSNDAPSAGVEPANNTPARPIRKPLPVANPPTEVSDSAPPRPVFPQKPIPPTPKSSTTIKSSNTNSAASEDTPPPRPLRPKLKPNASPTETSPPFSSPSPSPASTSPLSRPTLGLKSSPKPVPSSESSPKPSPHILRRPGILARNTDKQEKSDEEGVFAKVQWQSPEKTVADKLDELGSSAPRLSGPKRAARKARPPSKKKPVIETRTTTDDVNTGPSNVALSMMGGVAPFLQETTSSPLNSRRIHSVIGGPGLNIAALAAEQKGKLNPAAKTLLPSPPDAIKKNVLPKPTPTIPTPFSKPIPTPTIPPLSKSTPGISVSTSSTPTPSLASENEENADGIEAKESKMGKVLFNLKKKVNM